MAQRTPKRANQQQVLFLFSGKKDGRYCRRQVYEGRCGTENLAMARANCCRTMIFLPPTVIFVVPFFFSKCYDASWLRKRRHALPRLRPVSGRCVSGGLRPRLDSWYRPRRCVSMPLPLQFVFKDEPRWAAAPAAAGAAAVATALSQP